MIMNTQNHPVGAFIHLPDRGEYMPCFDEPEDDADEENEVDDIDDHGDK